MERRGLLAIGDCFYTMRLIGTKIILETKEFFQSHENHIRDEKLIEILSKGSTYSAFCGGGVITMLQVLRQTDVPVSFIGKAGDDDECSFIKHDLFEKNIEFILDISKNKPTYKLYVILKGNDRYLAGVGNIYDRFQPNFLPHNIQYINKAKIIALSCYFIVSASEDLDEFLNYIENDQLLALNVGALAVCYKTDLFKRYYERANIIVGNRLEVKNLYEHVIKGDKKEIWDIVEVVSNNTKLVVCTDGPNAIYYTDGKSVRTKKPATINLPFIDKYNSGDAFFAGVIYGVHENKNLNTIIDTGIEFSNKFIKHRSKELESLIKYKTP